MGEQLKTIELAPKDREIILYGGVLVHRERGPIGRNRRCFGWWVDDCCWRTYNALYVSNPTHWALSPDDISTTPSPREAAIQQVVEALEEYALLGSGKCSISKAHAEKARAALSAFRKESGEWWEGRAHDQGTHERINASNWPGTRQLCIDCGVPTGRCEDDMIDFDGRGPLCEDCYDDYCCGMAGRPE